MKYVVLVITSLAVFIGCNKDHRQPNATLVRDSIIATDACGTRVAVPTPAMRIVSLAPNLTEIIFALGAENILVGDTRYCTYPAAAQSITKVGDLQTPNYELIAALKPDVMFMSFSGNMPEAYEKARGLGLRPFLVSSKSIEDIEMAVITMAHVLGRDSMGKIISSVMCNAIDSLRAASQRRTPVDAVILLSANPLIAVGNGFLDEALTIAGGRNVAHNTIIAYPQLNREALVAGKPKVIFVPTDVKESTEELWLMFPEWRTLRASGTRIVRIDADPLSRPGPRIVRGISLMSDECRVVSDE